MTDSQLQTAITNIADGTPNTAAEIRAILNEMYLRLPKSNTIVIKDVTNQYIIDNFDGTGLGINLEVGYARVNGNNGTRDWQGRVPLAYGGTYTTMGATGGSPDSVVVEHSHSAGAYNTGSGSPIFLSKGLQNGSDTVYSRTNTEGVSGVGKNMQPYLVELQIMKL